MGRKTNTGRLGRPRNAKGGGMDIARVMRELKRAAAEAAGDQADEQDSADPLESGPARA